MKTKSAKTQLPRRLLLGGSVIVIAIAAVLAGHNRLKPSSDVASVLTKAAASVSSDQDHILSARQVAFPLFHDELGVITDTTYATKQGVEWAIKNCKEGLEIFPAAPTGHLALVRAYWKLHHDTQAVDEANTAIALDPGSPESAFQNGNLQYDLGNHEAARKAWAKSIALRQQRIRHPVTDPQNPWVQEAAVWMRTLGDAPDDSVIHTDVADALNRTGDLDGAMKEYRAAIALDPANELAHYGLAKALKDQNHLDEAIDEYRAALPPDPHARASSYEEYVTIDLALALALKGDIGQATERFNRAVERYPNIVPPDGELRLFRRRLADYISSNPDFDKARQSPEFQAALTQWSAPQPDDKPAFQSGMMR